MSLVGFEYLGTLKVPSVVGTSDPFESYIKFEDFTTLMLSKLDEGLGDLRLSLIDDTQLPLHIASGSKVSGGIQIHTRTASLFTNDLIKVWGNKTGQAKEVDGATYGRNAVYASWYGATSGTDIGKDLTGNGNISYNSVFPVSGLIGTAMNFNGQSDVVRLYNRGNTSLLTAKALIYVGDPLSAKNKTIMSKGYGNAAGATAWQFRVASNGKIAIGAYINGGNRGAATGGTVVPADTWVLAHATYDGTNWNIYYNGTLDGSGVGDGPNSTDQDIAVGNLYIQGSLTTQNQYFEGRIGRAQYRHSAQSADNIATEASNILATGAWWIAEDAASGEDVTVTPSAIQWSVQVSGASAYVQQQLTAQPIEQITQLSENKVTQNQAVSTQLVEQCIFTGSPQLFINQVVSTQLIEQLIFADTPQAFITQNVTTQAVEQLTLINALQLNAGAIYTVNPVEQHTYISTATINIDAVLTSQPVNYSFFTDNITVNVEQQLNALPIDYVAYISAPSINQALNFSTTDIEMVYFVTANSIYLGGLPDIDWSNIILYSITPQFTVISTTTQHILTRG
jgi:hypothetical protein